MMAVRSSICCSVSWMPMRQFDLCGKFGTPALPSPNKVASTSTYEGLKFLPVLVFLISFGITLPNVRDE